MERIESKRIYSITCLSCSVIQTVDVSISTTLRLYFMKIDRKSTAVVNGLSAICSTESSLHLKMHFVAASLKGLSRSLSLLL